MQALSRGATDFLNKPVDFAELILRVRNALTIKSQYDSLANQNECLEAIVTERTADLELSRLEVVYCLARAAEFRDAATGRHVLRVGRYANIIGRELGMSVAQAQQLELAAQLHDVGKIGVPDAILLKAGALTPEEIALVESYA